MQNCVALVEKLTEMDREITVNPQYVQKVRVLVNSINVIISLLSSICYDNMI